MADKPSLADKMRALAIGHPRATELIEKADAFEAAAKGFYSEPQTATPQRLLGTFARARRLWCDITGESLV